MVSFVVQSLQFEKPGRTMAKIAGTVLAVAYVGLLGSFTIQMRWFEGRLQGIVALVFLVATAKGADTGAYTMGRLAGRHKLWPRSARRRRSKGPWAAWSSASWPRSWSPRSPATASTSRPSTGQIAAVYGLVIGAVAQLGDLMESMIKRDCERKDASTAVPGFGGVLDVHRFAHLRRPGRLSALALVRALIVCQPIVCGERAGCPNSSIVLRTRRFRFKRQC